MTGCRHFMPDRPQPWEHGGMLDFDDEIARQVERVYMTPDVLEQRRITRAALALRPGEHVLDIGSGPGFLAAEMAEDVGPDGRVDGVDPSDSMLALSARRDTAARFQAGGALDLPFPDTSFDAAVSTQVLEYVEDVAAALAEARRVMRPGGRLLVLDTDWDSIVWHSSDDERMARVLEAWKEHLADPYLPRRLGRLLGEAGFEPPACDVVPLLNRGYDPDTYSAGLAPIIAAFVPGRRGVGEDEAAAWADDLARLGDEYFFSLNRYQFVATARA
jgi:arsenite methyltransferase